MQDLLRKTKSLLNKLTPNNFERLKTKALEFPINTEERLKGVIDLVFEKVGRSSPGRLMASWLVATLLMASWLTDG